MVHSISVLFLLLSLSNQSRAQDIGVKVDSSTAAEDTTISIKKGNNSAANKKKYVISEGNDAITGDKDVLKKNAEKNWKQACEDWKKETKDLNKENKVISVSCGSMTCAKDGVESSCKSVGTYKIRVLTEE